MRHVLFHLAIATVCFFIALSSCTVCANAPDATNPNDLRCDLLIVGGGESGCAAAVQAARMGVGSILLVNDIDWLGGQFSAEALVAIDENTHVSGVRHEQPIPRHGLFKEVIDRIEALNLKKYGVARPGNTRTITTTRPSDAARVFEDLLQPYVESGRLRIVRGAHPVAATMDDAGRALKAVRFKSDKTGKTFNVHAKLTVDASDWGDVIKLAGAEHAFGPDLKSKYNEPEAPASHDDYPVTDMNPITYCMVIVETDRYEPIAKPAHYDPRNYASHKWPKDPLWLYGTRRVIDRYHFKQIDHPDVLLLCFPAFDYPLDNLPQRVVDALEADERGASKKNIVQMSRKQRQIVFDDAKQYSLGFLYYLQTAVHDRMPDKTHSFRRFRLSEEFGTPDRLPFKPYVRESLRLEAMYMMRQQDSLGWRGSSNAFANVMYHDAVAVWQFEYDFHPTKREFLDDGDPAGPWRCVHRPLRDWGAPYTGAATFPMRSLIPVRVDGLLAGQHNLGFSSIVSSAVRLHDQSMAVGQAVGATAAVALNQGVQPRAIPYDVKLLDAVWRGLVKRHGDGGEPGMLWPFRDVDSSHPAYEAIQLLAVRGGLPLGPRDIRFKPNAPATDGWRRRVVELSSAFKRFDDAVHPPAGDMTRGEFAKQWWAVIDDLPDRILPFTDALSSKHDRDGDGIPDRDDALPLNQHASTWAGVPLPANRDGEPDALIGVVKPVLQINFTGKGSPRVAGYINDYGLPFDVKRSRGWSRDLSANHRRRGAIDGAQRDTFLFTRGHDRFEAALPNGRYRVTVCVGDSGHDQPGQRVVAESVVVFKDESTATGEFAEGTADVEVKDGRLTIEIGHRDLGGRKVNTCINWLRVVRAQPSDD